MTATSSLPPSSRSDRPSTTALSATRELHGSPPATSARPRRLAMLAAATLHLAVFLWLFHPWRGPPEQLPPANLPITLVFEPPAEPKPQTASEPVRPTAPSQGGWDRSSGPDAKTAAPPTVETDELEKQDKPGETASAPAPEEDVAAPPPPPAPEEEVAAPPPPPAPAIVAEPPSPAKPRPEPPRPAARPRPTDEKPMPHPQANAAMAMRPHAPPRHVEPGERRTTGDAYLNAALAEFEKHRFYPPLGRPLGLAGIAAFGLKIDRTGKILELWLEQSSGADLLDRAAEKMIRDTERVPPPPPDIPGDPVTFWIKIPLAPH